MNALQKEDNPQKQQTCSFIFHSIIKMSKMSSIPDMQCHRLFFHVGTTMLKWAYMSTHSDEWNYDLEYTHPHLSQNISCTLQDHQTLSSMNSWPGLLFVLGRHKELLCLMMFTLSCLRQSIRDENTRLSRDTSSLITIHLMYSTRPSNTLIRLYYSMHRLHHFNFNKHWVKNEGGIYQKFVYVSKCYQKRYFSGKYED